MFYDILLVLVSQLSEKIIIFCWVLNLENERDGRRETMTKGNESGRVTNSDLTVNPKGCVCHLE